MNWHFCLIVSNTSSFPWNKYFFLTVFFLILVCGSITLFLFCFGFSSFIKFCWKFYICSLCLPFICLLFNIVFFNKIQYGFLLPLAKKKTIRQHHRQRVISTDHNQETTEKKNTHTSLLLTSSFKNNKTHGFLNKMFLLIYFFSFIQDFFLSESVSVLFCFFFSLSCRLS